MRRVIITADDFGLSTPVNQAVERAHRTGIVSTASLMVAAPAAADAVRRARSMPALGVGLHVVVVNGRPVLPPEQIPHLVDRQGRLPTHLAGAGVAFFFHPAARRELAAEIRAQFEAFRATGLALDHVNAQNHMHVHPTVLSVILSIGREYGMRALRVPHEPFIASWRSARRGLWTRLGSALLVSPWAALVRARARGAGLATNDYAFGVNDAGAMTTQRILELLAFLPEGVGEILFHPATGSWSGADPATLAYAWEGELDALTSPELARALRERGIERIGFADLVSERAR